MQIKRSEFLSHLRRVWCNGQVKEVVFDGGFGAMALTPDHLLLVLAPPLVPGPGLGTEFGVADMDILAKAPAMIPGSTEDVALDVRLEDERLVIDEGERGVIRLLTAAPRVIATRFEEGKVAALLAKADPNEILLPAPVVAAVKSTFSGLRAEETELHLDAFGGTIRVGAENQHVAEFRLAQLKTATPYKVTFGGQLIDVFTVVEGGATIHLNPSLMLIAANGFRYLLSPRVRGVEGKKAVRSETADVEETAGVVGDE